MPRNEHPPEYYKSFKGSTFHYKNNSRITPQEINGNNFEKTLKNFKIYFFGVNLEFWHGVQYLNKCSIIFCSFLLLKKLSD